MKKILLLTLLSLFITSCGDEKKIEAGKLTTIAEMDINPGNAAVSPDGKIFTTIHQFRTADVKLVEIIGKEKFIPYPNSEWNDQARDSSDRFVSPLGVKVDSNNRLWVIDSGMDDSRSYAPKLLAFDLATGQVAFKHTFPAEVASAGTFPQDVAVDEKNGFVYVADSGMARPPALIVVDINNNRSRRVEGLKQFTAENRDLSVEGKKITVTSGDKSGPARIGLNPITISADKERLFFGSMNGTVWWTIPTKGLRENADIQALARSVIKSGIKPLSDGAATDKFGNHFFTDLENNAISVLTKEGKSYQLVKDKLLSWPDSIDIDRDGNLIIAVNQLHKAPFLNNGNEGAEKPFRIMKLELKYKN